MKPLLLMLFITACAKGPQPPDYHQVDDYKLIKLSVEPYGRADTLNCSYAERDSTNIYRLFSLGGDTSQRLLCAKNTSLNLSDKDYSYIRVEHTAPYHWIPLGDKWAIDASQQSRKYSLYLVPCSKFRDTQRYVIKESSSDSSVLMGFVYNSHSSSKEYQLRDEDLVMPCLKGM